MPIFYIHHPLGVYMNTKFIWPLILAACTSISAKANVLTGPIVNPVNGHSYFLLSQNNWTGSEAEAVNLGGHLVTINDAAENAWIVDTFSEFGGISRAIWAGMNDSASEGTFVWSSGESVAYTNWGPNEPNDNFGEDYTHIFPTMDGRFPTWNDAPDAADAFGFTFNGVVEIPVPEPETYLIVLSGLLILGAHRKLSRLLPSKAP